MNSTRQGPLLILLVLPAAAFAQQSTPSSTAATSSPPVSPPSTSSPTSRSAAASSFDSLDTNHDGVLSREELAARTPNGGVQSNGANATHGENPTPNTHDDAGNSPAN